MPEGGAEDAGGSRGQKLRKAGVARPDAFQIAGLGQICGGLFCTPRLLLESSRHRAPQPLPSLPRRTLRRRPLESDRTSPGEAPIPDPTPLALADISSGATRRLRQLCALSSPRCVSSPSPIDRPSAAPAAPAAHRQHASPLSRRKPSLYDPPPPPYTTPGPFSLRPPAAHLPTPHGGHEPPNTRHRPARLAGLAYQARR